MENLCQVRDTDRWRQELATLASASGLGVEKEEHKPVHRPGTNTEHQHASRSGARYSARTGRFNEGTPKSRGRTGSRHGTGHPDSLFQMPENEREMWVSDQRYCARLSYILTNQWREITQHVTVKGRRMSGFVNEGSDLHRRLELEYLIHRPHRKVFSTSSRCCKCFVNCWERVIWKISNPGWSRLLSLVCSPLSVVRSSPTLAFRLVEKEHARTMISSALEGLKESERTSSNPAEQSVDLDALTSFVER